MRVLVTGSSGFIGWHATRLLVEAGVEVHASSRHQPDDLPGEVVFHQADLLLDGSADFLINASKPSHLLHFAWNAQPGAFWNATDNLDWVAASIRLYRAFADAGGGRTVFAGSCAEYDWSHPMLSEQFTALAPDTLYGTCKDALRRAVEKTAVRDDVSMAWGRIFWLFGPREQRGRLIPDLVTGLLAGRDVPCTQGTQCRDFMHVEDVARAFVQLLMSDVKGAINIASGISTPVSDVISLTANLVGRPELVRLGALPGGQSQPDELLAEIETLRDMVGFRPKFGLQAGLLDTIEWWKRR